MLQLAFRMAFDRSWTGLLEAKREDNPVWSLLPIRLSLSLSLSLRLLPPPQISLLSAYVRTCTWVLFLPNDLGRGRYRRVYIGQRDGISLAAFIAAWS